MAALDPFDAMVANLRGLSDQTIAFYREHLFGLVAAYRANNKKHDRDALLNMMVKALVESDNSREDLCYQVIVAVDELSRQ